MQKDNIMVSIRCLTYNHAPYIRECLDGFVMQKTNFTFEIVIHDDASTDGTADIIREYEKKYPHLFNAIYETENQYSKQDGSIPRIVNPQLRGKYVAYCEGDDYWIDPYKLQKQVDILESDPECSLVYTSYRRYVQEEKRYMDDFIVDKEGYIYENFFQSVEYDPCILTLTVCVRSEILYNLPPMPQGAFKGDTYMWIAASLKGKIRILKDVTGVYRLLSKSASHFTDKVSSLKFNYELLKMKLAILNLYPIKNINNTLELKKTYLRNIVKYSLLTNNHSIYSDFQNDKKYFGEAKYRVKLFIYYFFREKHLFSCLSWIYRKFYN